MLKTTLSEEQFSAFKGYVAAHEELSSFIEVDCFRVGFSIGTNIVMEVLN